MVTAHNQSRLGNFLYQTAAAAAHAWKNGVEPRFAETSYSKYFPKLLPIRPEDLVSEFYQENGAGYQELPFINNMCLVGFYQSYLYYNDYREQILDLFDFGQHETQKDICSIHIRRGDYLDYPLKHPVVDRPYLEPAMKYMSEHGYKRFCCFGDDHEWIKDNLNSKIYPDYEFYISEETDPYKDLGLMSSFSSNIICNSTYSIWAAELNRNPKKIIVTPSEDNYYGPSHKDQDVSDLLRPEWIKIKY